jgi:lipopolysaccharide transport system permease protein
LSVHAKAKESDWDLEVDSKIKLIDLKLDQLYHYRDLVILFFKRDFSTAYKQTILGPLWYIVNPLISTILYTFVFGKLAKLGTDGIPFILFYYSGTMLWTYFSTCFVDASNVFTNNVALFGKVYFPRLTVPISRAFVNLVTAGIQLATLAIFYVYYLVTGSPIHLSCFALLTPLLFVWIGLFAIGLGMVISALTTKYKDLRQLVTYGVSLFMYATPVVYPVSQAPERYRWLFWVNPLSAPIELFRLCVFGSGTFSWGMIFVSLASSITIFLFGLIIFNHNERTFVDVF